MRRIISLSMALCLTLFGAAGMAYLLFFAVGWKGWMVMGAGLLFTAGALWLYDDFADMSSRR